MNLGAKRRQMCTSLTLKGTIFGLLDAFGNSSGMKDKLPIMF